MSFMLLGILNSQAAGGGQESNFDLLETATLSNSASSISFNSLNTYSDYKDLQLRIVARSTASEAKIFMTINGATGSSYSDHSLRGNGSAVGSGAAFNQTNSNLNFWTPGDGTDPVNVFSSGIVDILDFSSTSKSTTVRNINGYVSNFQQISINSGMYNSTGAVSQLTLFLQYAASFVAGTRISLYGSKEV
jgi:hypothetical protein